jgi:hypothetical protein
MLGWSLDEQDVQRCVGFKVKNMLLLTKNKNSDHEAQDIGMMLCLQENVSKSL